MNFQSPNNFNRPFHIILCRAVLLVVLLASSVYAMDADTKVLVVVLDGFRADYFTPELMPHCFAEAQKGVIGEAHHAALPTVTRVNAATLATGCYPAGHGLVANTLYVPAISPQKGVSTANRAKLLETAKAWGGRLLATPTLAEVLAMNGQTFLACSSGSAGSATLMNPEGAGAGILHPEFCVPKEKTEHMYAVLGPEPPETEPALPAMHWMTDAYLKIGIPEYAPRVTYLWYTDPDHTGHEKGIGAKETLEGIRIIDEQLERIFTCYRAHGMKVNVFVVADHGFATYGGTFDVAATLKAAGFIKDGGAGNPVVIDGAVYLPDGREAEVPAMVQALQRDPKVGAIFTAGKKPGRWEGHVPGTISHEWVGCNHPHTAAIVACPNWDDAKNAFGYPGHVENAGVASHGAPSPWEIHGVFAAFGPDIKRGLRSGAPSSNADIAPTIAFLADIPIPPAMTGRVLRELFNGEPAPDQVKVRHKRWKSKSADGRYEVELQASISKGRRYVDFVSGTHR